MSKFKTTIPFNVDEVKKLLPPGAFFDRAEYLDGHLHVYWEHDQFKTPYTFPLEFPIENLKRCEVPEKVKVSGEVAAIPVPTGTIVPPQQEQTPEVCEQPVVPASEPATIAEKGETAPAAEIPAEPERAAESGTIVPVEPEEKPAPVPTQKKKSAAGPKSRR